MKSEHARRFYRQVDSKFYERTALSKNKVAMLADPAVTIRPAETDKALTPEEAFRDPFVLEFLDLKDEYSESDLASKIARRVAELTLRIGVKCIHDESQWCAGCAAFAVLWIALVAAILRGFFNGNEAAIA